MPRTRHGGKRTPRNPAAASGPGRLSARTDGDVPETVPSGGDYGDRKALRAQMDAAPVDQPSQGGGQASVPAQGAARPLPFGAEGIFGPTGRPGEPMTAGVDTGPGRGREFAPGGDDPYLLLRLIHDVAPSRHTARLLARLGRA